MRTYAWFATMAVVAAGSSACSTSTRTKFAAAAADFARADDAAARVASARPQPPARVVASPVVATPRAIGIGETPPSDPAAIGSPDAQPLAPIDAPSVPSRPCNATCPVMVGMPVDPACTVTWHGCCVAFCDAYARGRWEASPATFASNLPPTLSETPIRAPFPGARLVAAPAPAPAEARKPVAAPPAASVASVPLAPVPSPKASPGAGPIDLFGEGECEDGECKDGSCRLPLPPR
jgi:hypothetical protein